MDLDTVNREEFEFTLNQIIEENNLQCFINNKSELFVTANTLKELYTNKKKYEKYKQTEIHVKKTKKTKFSVSLLTKFLVVLINTEKITELLFVNHLSECIMNSIQMKVLESLFVDPRIKELQNEIDKFVEINKKIFESELKLTEDEFTEIFSVYTISGTIFENNDELKKQYCIEKCGEKFYNEFLSRYFYYISIYDVSDKVAFNVQKELENIC